MGGERQRGDGGSAPQQQFMQAELVPSTLAAESDKRVAMDSGSIIVLAILAGMFVALGGLLSVLLSAGVETEGPRLLLAGRRSASATSSSRSARRCCSPRPT